MRYGRSIAPPDRRHGDGQRLRLLFAFMVMCLAVVPHLTLAASPMRMPVAASVMHEAGPSAPPAASAESAADTAPCHPPRPPQGGHPAAAPVCCIIGCGLIAEAAAIALPSRAILWSRPALGPAEPLAGISPEPVKPPPRA